MVLILKKLLEITIYSSIIIITVLILSVLFKKKTFSRTRFFFGILILIKLLIPITISSPIHIDSFMKFNSTSAAENEELANIKEGEEENSIILDKPNIVSPRYVDFDYNNLINDQKDNKNVLTQQTIDRKKSVVNYIKLLDYKKIVFSIWIIGILVNLLIYIQKSIKLWIVIKKTKPTIHRGILNEIKEKKKIIGIKKNIVVKECDFVTMPMSYGVINPQILIPIGYPEKIGMESLALVFIHELVHIKRNDLLFNTLWLIAKVIYWFNPLVLFSYNLFTDDVEKLCDENVVSIINEESKYIYIDSLVKTLKLCNYNKKSTFIGINLVKGKSKLKERIEIMLVSNKNKKHVTLTSCIIAMIIILSCFTTACQPTPKEIIVEQKGDEKILDALNSTAEPITEISDEKEIGDTNSSTESNLLPILSTADYNTVETVSFDINLSNNYNLSANAEVNVPITDSYPVYSYKRKEFDEEFIKDIFDALLDDNPFYEYLEGTDGMTKSEIEEAIVAIKYDYRDLETPLAKYAGITDINWLNEVKEDKLKDYVEALPYATDYVEYNEIQKKLTDGCAFGTAMINEDEKAEFRIVDNEYGFKVESNQSIGIRYSMIGNDGMTTLARRVSVLKQNGTFVPTTGLLGPFIHEIKSQPSMISMTPIQASNIAESTFKQMGAGDDVKVSEIYLIEIPKGAGFDDIYCYGIVLNRYVNNMPISIDTSSKIGAEKNNTDFSDQFNAGIPKESMTVFINDLGIIDLEWTEPIEFISVINSNVKIAPTDEIIDSFKKYYSFSYAILGPVDEVQKELDFSLNEIRLHYCIARIPNNNDEYMAIPLWEFYSTVPIVYFDRDMNPFTEEQHENLLTINAIDKSRFVHQWGY